MASRLLVLLISLLSSEAKKEFCPRLFFKNIDESTMPYTMIEGVYVKQNQMYSNFPIYRRESTEVDLLFYRVYSPKIDMRFGRNVESTFGLGAKFKDGVSFIRWLYDGKLNRSDVFDGLISSWYLLDLKGRRYQHSWREIHGSPLIKAICVHKSFHQCDSNEVYINKELKSSGKTLNDPAKDYFIRKIGEFRNLRPVYVHSTRKWYLQYHGKYWFISKKYPETVSPGDFIKNEVTYLVTRVKDLALRPEFITNAWEFYNGNTWETTDAKFRCRGLFSGINKCATRNNLCGNNSTCRYTPGNGNVCLCRNGYTGPHCRDIGCGLLNLELKVINAKYVLNSSPGSLALVSCAKTLAKMEYALCRRQGNKTRWGFVNPAGYCAHRLAKQTQTASGFDSNPHILPGILSMAIILQVLLPFLIGICWACLLCNEDTAEMKRQRQRKQKRKELTERLLGPIPEWLKECEKDKQSGYPTLGRLYSMGMFFSFFLWGAFLIGCHKYQCLQYGEIFYHLWLMAIVMCVLAPLIVLIESLFSNEWVYIKHTMKDESAQAYIQKMIKVAPVITMEVQCYHYESKTKTVTITESNGRVMRISKNKGEKRKVVTHTDRRTFHFGSWADTSSKMPDLNPFALTRLKFNRFIEFGDRRTAEDYDAQKEDIMTENRYRDEHMKLSCKAKIPGFKRRILACRDLGHQPCWLGSCCYWFVTCLCMTWPYRWFFKAKTAKINFTLEKKMYKSQSRPVNEDINYFEVCPEPPTPHDPARDLNEGMPDIPMAEIRGASGTTYPSAATAQPCSGATPNQVHPPPESGLPFLAPNGQGSNPAYPTVQVTFPGRGHLQPTAPPFPPITQEPSQDYQTNTDSNFQFPVGVVADPTAPPPSYEEVMRQGAATQGNFSSPEEEPLCSPGVKDTMV